MRWFGLACFIILLVVAWRRRDLKHYAISLISGGIVGFAVDLIGINLGLWSFPRQPFLDSSYWLIVVPCWGVFGATINMVNDWYLKSNWRSIILISLLVMGIYEIPNLVTGSWHYTVSAILIIVGWFPLVCLFRISYLLIVRHKLIPLWESKDVVSQNRSANSL